MRLRQAPLCRYWFNFIFDGFIFLLSGNIIEHICFWRFNSINMTWNKWLVFTKSIIIGLNNISQWPCPLWRCLCTMRITWLYPTPLLCMRAYGLVVWLSLRIANVPMWLWYNLHVLSFQKVGKCQNLYWLQYQKLQWNFIMFKFSAVSQIWKKYIFFHLYF